ncbi:MULTISPECIES: BRO-N domain-containing protein [Streptomyces]|uniref:BRO-N domain-containing protein n=1 Tax=Streptomyces TaxID=1883 RepID=UPI0004CCCC6A|nr:MULTISPECIES: Bro-N domain-containing protein [Streptomyces]KOT48053.1 DNA-binding protein [Streptomyces rimosus subsp. rimosus]
MSEYDTPACPESRQDAMDVSDFVYAATGARVRRITLPNGEHWFPAADICRELGYTTTRKALLDHVPEERRESLATVTGSHSLGIPAGRGWRRDLQMVDLQGLVLLVNGCTKPSCLPFKTWVSEVIVTIQREGSYSLRKAGTPLPGPGVPMAYAMPTEVADTIVRLEERNLRVDEEYADLRRQEMRLFGRIADSLDRIADKLDAGAQTPGGQPTLTADELLADWKERQLVVTGDIWAVAAYLAPALVNSAVASYPLRVIAQRTGLTEHRVHDSLRMLLKRGCFRQVGVGTDGAPRYTLRR